MPVEPDRNTDLPRGGTDTTPATVDVVAGALVAPDGSVLIAERPPGKAFAGRWEFPGGKLCAGETAREALKRELAEELGVYVDHAEPLLAVTYRYAGTQAAVRIDCWRVLSWRGEPTGLDGQRLRWCPRAALVDADILEADRAIVTALRLPSRFVHIALAAEERAPRAPVAWLVDSAAHATPAGGAGDLLCVVDPATPVTECRVYTTAAAFLPAAERRALAGLVVRDARQAAAAAARGADFLLVPEAALAAAELAGIAAAGLPWYLPSAAPVVTGSAPPTGALCWPAAADALRR